MGLLFGNSGSVDVENAVVPKASALPVPDGIAADLQLADCTAMVTREDMEAVLAPCRAVQGVFGSARGTSRDIAFQKALFARACWELSQEAGFEGGLEGAVDLVCLRPDTQWPALATAGKGKGDSRTYGNVRRWITRLGKDKRGVPQWSAWGRLVKGHGGGRESNLDEDFMRWFMRAFLTQAKLGAKQVWRRIAVEFRRKGWEKRVPSYDQVARYVREKVPNDVMAKYRRKKGEWSDSWMGYVKRYCNVEVGDVAYMDHRIVDFFVREQNADGEWVAARPYVTALADARSGYITAANIYVSEHPNHRTILDTILHHIVACDSRVPKIIYTDQGKDFLKLGMSRSIRVRTQRGGHVLCDRNDEPYEYGIFRALGIRHEMAAAYRGQQKPVERWFRDHATDHDQWAAAYTGNKPGARPDQDVTWQGDIMALPTVEDAKRAFNEWLQEIGHQHMREDGKTRAQMWEGADLSHLVQYGTEDLALRMLLPHRKARKVGRTPWGKCGIQYAGWWYGHADLVDFEGEYLVLKTAWRASTVEVQVQTRTRGLVWREVPSYVCVFSPDDVLLAVCPAARISGSFAIDETERAEIGAAKHIHNTLNARTTDRYEELTGRRVVDRPANVLRQISGGEERPEVDGVVQLGAFDGERNTRRLRGGGRGPARAVQEPTALPTVDDWSDLMDEPEVDPEPSELEMLLRKQHEEEQGEW